MNFSYCHGFKKLIFTNQLLLCDKNWDNSIMIIVIVLPKYMYSLFYWIGVVYEYASVSYGCLIVRTEGLIFSIVINFELNITAMKLYIYRSELTSRMIVPFVK